MPPDDNFNVPATGEIAVLLEGMLACVLRGGGRQLQRIAVDYLRVLNYEPEPDGPLQRVLSQVGTSASAGKDSTGTENATDVSFLNWNDALQATNALPSYVLPTLIQRLKDDDNCDASLLTGSEAVPGNGRGVAHGLQSLLQDQGGQKQSLS